MILRFIVILICLACQTNSDGQTANTLRFSAKVAQEVRRYTLFGVTYTIENVPDKDSIIPLSNNHSVLISGAVTDFLAPNFIDFNLISGPKISITRAEIKGRMYKSVTFFYVLLPKQEGIFHLSKASIKVDNSRIESNDLTVHVVAGFGSKETFEERKWSDSIQSGLSNDIFIKLRTNKDTIFEGEAIIAGYQFYSKTYATMFHILQLPESKDFLSYDVPLHSANHSVYRLVNDIVYSEADILKQILYPKRLGTLNIEPVELLTISRVLLGSYAYSSDSLFQFPHTVKSKPASVFVKELPQKNKPTEFNAAVGNFQMDSIAYPKIKAIIPGQKAIFSIWIKGTGNLDSIQPPNIKFPPTFKISKTNVLKPIKDSLDESIGLNGVRQFVYTFSPTIPGVFEISEILFSYFDPIQGKYVTLKQPGFSMTVTKPE